MKRLPNTYFTLEEIGSIPEEEIRNLDCFRPDARATRSSRNRAHGYPMEEFPRDLAAALLRRRWDGRRGRFAAELEWAYWMAAKGATDDEIVSAFLAIPEKTVRGWLRHL